MKPLCIYHGNCADGFTAAWVVRKALGEGVADFFAGVYQTPPPDVTDRDVFIVDFSYKRPVLEEMAKKARSITILDHHKTAAEDLMGLPPAPDWFTSGGVPFPGLWATFDMNRSGAGMAWDYFMNGPRPQLVNHIEDRDLWKFALRGTREIQASVFSYAYDFKTWDHLMEASIEDGSLDDLRKEGEAIERKHFKDIRELTDVVMRPMFIGGHVIPMANLPYTLTSDAGHMMARGKGTEIQPDFPFAGCYWDTPKGRVFSLRSTEGGADVSAIAKQYGGGGHAHASGFTVPWTRRPVIDSMDMPEGTWS